MWCTVLGLGGVLLRTSAWRAGAEAALLGLAAEACDRMLLALEPPAGTPAQPLTLGMLKVILAPCSMLNL